MAEIRIALEVLYRKTWAIFKGNLFAIIMVNLIAAVPANIINYILSSIQKTSSFLFVFDILSLFMTLVAGISSLATVYIAVNTWNGMPPMSMKESFSMAYKRWGTSITTGILQYLISSALILLFIIPGIVWMVYYAFAYQAVALTGFKWKKALNYSKFIVKGNWWKVFGNLFSLSLVPAVIYCLMFFPHRYLIKTNPEFNALIILINIISNVLFSFVNVGTSILYLNLSSLKETSNNEKTVYEKINAYVNKNVSILSGETEDIGNLGNMEEYEEDFDDDSLRCSICGIKVEPDQVVCPMCHSIIR